MSGEGAGMEGVLCRDDKMPNLGYHEKVFVGLGFTIQLVKPCSMPFCC
jgi:hypothetical protein